MQNGICEAFNGRMRDELLNETVFYDLDHARAALARSTAAYNHRRPHSALGYLTPAAFAATFTATGDRLRNPDQLRRGARYPQRTISRGQFCAAIDRREQRGSVCGAWFFQLVVRSRSDQGKS